MRHQPTARRVSGGLCLIQVRSPNPLPTASLRGGGIDNYSTLAMYNTIIANSTGGGDCVSVGTIRANVHNLVEDGSCGAARADLHCDVGAFELQYADSDTVVKVFSDTQLWPDVGQRDAFNDGYRRAHYHQAPGLPRRDL